MNIKIYKPNKCNKNKSYISIFFLITCIFGCTNTPNSVVVTSATIIGVDISQDTATQSPSATLGYKRAEFAFVPTNKALIPETKQGEQQNEEVNTSTKHKGADETANVLMELRYSGIFSTGENSGIYQRLAVGDIAVKQDGATVLFSKDAKGKVNDKAVGYLGQAEEALKEEEISLIKLISYLTNDSGGLDISKRDKLIAVAKQSEPKLINSYIENLLKGTSKLSELKKHLSDLIDFTIPVLVASIPKE